MTVCPVCEHEQARGAECDECGTRLLHGAAAIPDVPPVEGLEPTRHHAVDVGTGRIPDMEPTRHHPVSVADDPVPGVEPTRALPVDVAVEEAPDLERTAAAIPGDAPTAIPVFVTCRYCRTPSLPGERICARCGMRLPTFEPSGGEADEVARLCSCGAPVRGPRCPSCGASVR